MYSKYINKNKLFLLFSFTISLSLLFPTSTSNSKEFLTQKKTQFRNMQDYVKFSDKSIFYKTEFPKNDITGTGDILQDSPYKALCIIKNCPNKCCIGDINALVCASASQCQEFYDTSIIGNVIAAIIFPLFFLAVFLVCFHCFHKRCKDKGLSALLAFFCIFIITIPIVLFVIWKYKLFPEPEKKNK